jgi:LmbE family N-acetylglucosaminyl deacetylase
MHIFTRESVLHEPVAYVNITDQIEQKIELIKKHQSQFAWMNTFMDDDFTDYCRTLSRMRGIQAGFKYAEGFIGHKILGYVCDYRLLP